MVNHTFKGRQINQRTNKSIGTANSKVSFIRSITDAVLNGDIDFDSLKEMNNSDVFKYLTSFKGIGNGQLICI